MAWNVNTFALLIPLLFLLVGLTVTVALDPYISKKHRIVMWVIIALSVVLIGQNLLSSYLETGAVRPMLRTAVSVLGYTVRPVFLILFLYIVQPGKKYLACWALATANWAIHMTAFFSHLCFWIDGDNLYHGGPLSHTCLVISIFLMAYLLFESIRSYRASRKRDILIPVLMVGIILVSVYADQQLGTVSQPITALTFATVICCLFYYIWLHLRFVRDHEDDLKAQQRIQIMLSQIQPHFLYNTLSTIQSLCRTDPEKAFDVTEKFGAYLRRNLDSLNRAELIPIQKELEHTRIYAEIEAVRFPHIRIEYEIGDTEFSVPALTIQPIVENAIRHGVRIRQNGLVTVTTRKDAACHEIIVSDNGKGFDPATLEQAGQAHIGIRNVRERISTMCGGSLTVDSRPDEGTTVTIRIPCKSGTAIEKEAEP